MEHVRYSWHYAWNPMIRTSPYPHAATAIGLAIAADQDAGYQLQERFTRHCGVWREAEDGRAVAFDVVFAKDSVLPAQGEAHTHEAKH